MFSINLLKTFTRRCYNSKVNGRVIYRGRRLYPESVTLSCGKMLESFDFVFQNLTDKKYASSSMDYDKKTIDAKNNDRNNCNIQKEEGDQSDHCQEYEEAVKALNKLQTNAESLSTALKKRYNSLEDTRRCLERTGVFKKDLEKLSYIHVSGTKGKGSTCSLVDSILSCYGYKTGFYSSPHLVSVTERLRINGQPISKQKFTQYFWPVYNKLMASQEFENDMPAYFKFLTVMAFHVYLGEKVDVVILEVGIGGELDCTNVAPHTKTVGITSLGLEHTQLLGETLKEIAWQKAGIIKPNSTVYTSVTQDECLDIIYQRAKEQQAQVYRVPKFEEYFQDPKLEEVKQQLNNCAILNGSVALQLAYDWLRQNRNGFHRDFDINKPRLTKEAVSGILNCNWPGRCQKVKFQNFNIHLDGAHTVESIKVCGNWFSQVSANSDLPKIIIFNTTGDRDTLKLLNILHSFSSFDLVCFTPNIAFISDNGNQDNKSVLYDHEDQMKRLQKHASNWQETCQKSGEASNTKVFNCVAQCFQYIGQTYDKSQELNILVTGSLHLIGATILTLNELPKLESRTGLD